MFARAGKSVLDAAQFFERVIFQAAPHLQACAAWADESAPGWSGALAIQEAKPTECCFG
jgi:hypothetical protein